MAAFVQKTGSKWFAGFGPPQTQSVVLPSVVAGATIVVFVGWHNGAVNITNIADDKGNTYATDITGITDLAVGQAAMYYVKAAAAGTTTITVTWGADPGYGNMQAWEGAGRDASAPLDKQAATRVATPGASPISGGSVTPATNNQWVVTGVFDEDGGANYTVGAGFGHFDNQSTVGAGEDLEQTSAAAVASTWGTDALFETYLMILATFKAAGAGGPVNGPRIGRQLLRPNAFAPGFGR